MQREKKEDAKKIVKYIRKLHQIANFDKFKKNHLHDLTDSQSNLLRELYQIGQLSSAELSRRLYVTPANITGIIDRLEKKKLVIRSQKKNDRRITFINLTEKGSDLIKDTSNPMEEKLLSGFDNISSDKVDQLKGSLKEIINLLESGKRKKHSHPPDT